jgi:hypothetical protein
LYPNADHHPYSDLNKQHEKSQPVAENYILLTPSLGFAQCEEGLGWAPANEIYSVGFWPNL